MGETYYEILGVEPDASSDEIRAAYRERVLETHPDQNDAPDAAERFKRISAAESVLTDGTERARYDRLGHDAYVRLAQGPVGEGDSADETGGGGEQTRDEPGANSRTGPRTDGQRTNAGHARSTSGWTRSGSGRDDRTRSHHARQRNRRRRTKSRRRAEGNWPFENDRGRGSENATGTTRTERGPDGGTAPGFQYAVHDWEDPPAPRWEDRPLEYTTAVTMGCTWLLYPVFVAASLTPTFPTLVNGIVAACTVGVVAYLLTRPRIAIAVFGFWAVSFPVGMVHSSAVSLSAITGAIALGFVWVPFGYAIVLRWALRS